jgi:glycosyltransferase involved in cell wall biosynthesis
MQRNAPPVFLVIAGFPDSIISFRGILLQELIHLEFDVHVAAPDLSAANGLCDRLSDLGVTPHEIPLVRAGMNPFSDLRLFISLLVLCIKLRPACVLSYTAKPIVYGQTAAFFAGCSRRVALITGLGYAFLYPNRTLLSRVLRKMYKLALGLASKAIFQNSDDEKLLRQLGILGNRVPSCVVNGSGVDLEFFPNTAIHTGRKRFLMIARLLGDKGVREYVQAALKIKTKYEIIDFALAGWIDENPDSISVDELESWIDQGAIEYLGRLDDVRPAIEASTVYVLPSYREGTPRTVLEAMAMGRPIITTDAPGCRETVIDGENGFLVPVKSVDALVEAMQRFIDNPDLAVEMGRRSREIAEEKYDVHKVNAVMLREMGIT